MDQMGKGSETEHREREWSGKKEEHNELAVVTGNY